MSKWTHAICQQCWNERNPGRVPCRIREEFLDEKDFRPDHVPSLLALLARVRLEEAEHIQFEVNWRLGNALLNKDPKIKEAHRWLKGASCGTSRSPGASSRRERRRKGGEAP